MTTQAVFDTSEVLWSYGVKYAVLSPGSRNAPLTVSFARNPRIQKYSVLDERSAAFIALGISLKSQSPVALCCTSGTALLNYGPACAEAYYQQVPLIILSADRPAALIDQRDGQTIRQVDALSNFVKGSFNLPEDTQAPNYQKVYNQTLKTALELSIAEPQGPVHINAPFREPFYPQEEQQLKFSEFEKAKFYDLYPTIDFEPYAQLWHAQNKKMILRGQDQIDIDLDKRLLSVEGVVIVADVISNIGISSCIRRQDLFLKNLSEKEKAAMSPEILITCGKSIISKNLKLFLRDYKPIEHWHFEKCSVAPDPFKSITTHFKADIKDFLDAICTSVKRDDFSNQIAENYVKGWKNIDNKTLGMLKSHLDTTQFSEFKACYKIGQAIPSNTQLHLANSMPVRYVNFIQELHENVHVFANRGTSGIDGSNSTAVGCAAISHEIVTLMSGDLSFFYDRNAFFNYIEKSNLRIIVFNNGGGGIFRILPDSSSLPELEQYFETVHTHSAIHICNEYNLEYYTAKNDEELDRHLDLFFEESDSCKLLEVFTSSEKNKTVFNKINEVIRL